ncbi:monovalent cation:proton antiporter-2 (CPA2) family protein [Leisingera aquaemixtae]|jgi:CPA2 family monovalent cation:H+ antiporter-2|uniref:K(+)/H(+) antiporter n=1 Tax=Leisingera aquaemixtae TaxID=1396826 RepID=A0A0P1H5C7_9RHOB|nr:MULTISPECIES: monovalent cation:proton antiporter-2 (CPA2) family protein [Leisingera]QDI75215.1 potassium transporter [Leisingera aquaemixtae]UWQ23679.1 monovalent cation:proton antiporter-2 (CPA2) family protein [Leisingera aquaemixtae]UWQ36203.1 monovalent cation:proton antiporter-2 (CPA2) family protein [Leisingera aquaemixtae]UWQ40310.1 monovalent cation:proton antiporter-2 (CPA2) family protein [Leisingera aquaemixtae]UWQ44563.1 monovalent cation:proton antiporter-2 (CPA2) family prot
MEEFFYQATVYLAAAVIAVPLAARLGLGSVLGYLAAGIAIGPVLGLTGTETEDLRHFAEFGVVMMLFLIGLELEPRALWAMRHKLLGLGGMQISLSTLALMGAAMAMGQPWHVSLAIGLALSLSSTAIVLQTLSEKGLMRTGGGRSAFSVLLTQDIAVIPILAFLPLLGSYAIPQFSSDGSIILESDSHGAGHGSLSLVDGLPGWAVTLVTLAAIAFIILAGIYLTRPLFRFIHASNLREMYTALALMIVVGISFLMTLVGLSPALGAFLAGVVLANSEFRHELESDLNPFKGLLLGLFFITVGAGIDYRQLLADPADLIGLAALVIFAKGAVLFAVGRAFGLRRRGLWLFTLSLAQAGEFGFVLLTFSRQLNVIPAALSEKLLLVIALSMLITPLLFILYDFLSKRMADARQEHEPDEIDEEGPVIIAGIGRFGQIVNRLVQASGFKTVVLDHDMEAVQLMRRFGVKSFLGDPTRPELLKAAGIAKAKVFVVALDDPEGVVKMVSHVRRAYPDLHIIARAKDRNHVYELYQAGADDIVRELFDSSVRAGRYVLENVGLTEYEAAQAAQTFYNHDRQNLRDLAEHWVPGTPASQNPAYIERARELEKALESAIFEMAERKRKKSSEAAE